MSLTVRLYGKIRDLATRFDDASDKIGLVDIDEPVERVADVLEILGVEEEDISHVFLNGEYSTKNRKVREGDRLALFSKDISLIYGWYFSEKDDD